MGLPVVQDIKSRVNFDNRGSQVNSCIKESCSSKYFEQVKTVIYGIKPQTQIIIFIFLTKVIWDMNYLQIQCRNALALDFTSACFCSPGHVNFNPRKHLV